MPEASLGWNSSLTLGCSIKLNNILLQFEMHFIYLYYVVRKIKLDYIFWGH